MTRSFVFQSGGDELVNDSYLISHGFVWNFDNASNLKTDYAGFASCFAGSLVVLRGAFRF